MKDTITSRGPVPRRRHAAAMRSVVLAVLGVMAIPGAVLAFSLPVPVVLSVVAHACRPPSAAQLDDQRRFVLAHLPDARNVEVSHQDCDDKGRGYVEFVTALTPPDAAGRFLTDPACVVSTDTAGSDAAIDCTSHEIAVFIAFDARKAGSDGYLDMPPL